MSNNTIQERFQIKHGTIQIAQFLVSILLFSHWLGTLFYFLTGLKTLILTLTVILTSACKVCKMTVSVHGMSST